MKNVRQLCVLALVACCVAPSFAQETGKEKGKGKGKGNPTISRAFALPKTVELTDAQKEQVAALRKKHAPALEMAAKKVGLTKEQTEAMAEARKTAMADGKKGKDLQAAVAAAGKLTDEQQAGQKEMQKLLGDVKKELMAILTPEQREAIGGRAAGEKKPKAE